MKVIYPLLGLRYIPLAAVLCARVEQFACRSNAFDVISEFRSSTALKRTMQVNVSGSRGRILLLSNGRGASGRHHTEHFHEGPARKRFQACTISRSGR